MRHRIWLSIATALLLRMELASADETVWYSDASTREMLESRLGWLVERNGLSLGARMTLQGDDGITRVRPRVTSAWTASDRLDIDAVLRYGDWNRAADPFAPQVDTNVRFRPPTPYVERVVATVQRTRAATNRSLQVAFSPVRTGLTLWGGDPLGLDADLTIYGRSDETVKSRLASSWGIGEAIDVDTALRLQSSGAADSVAQAWDTRVVYHSPLPLVERLEGRLEHQPSGLSRQTLGLGFPGISGAAPVHGEPLTLSSKAVLTETLLHGARDALRFGIETRMTGFAPPLLGGRNALSLKLERRFQMSDGRASLIYDHAWAPTDMSAVGLNFEVLGEADDIEPTLDLTWKTRF